MPARCGGSTRTRPWPPGTALWGRGYATELGRAGVHDGAPFALSAYVRDE